MRKTSSPDRRAKGTLLVATVALFAAGALTDHGPLLLGGGDADAVIGRPLTPMSYAGVARRTTRRAAYAGAYGGAAYYAPPPAVPTTAVVTGLPPDCARVAAGGGVYYQCGGGARYAPYYNGPTLVYRPI